MSGTNTDKEYPSRIIMTDDPLRAKMLVELHMERAALEHEKSGLAVYYGSYKNVSVTVVSTGLDCCGVVDFLSEAGIACLSEIIFIGECISFSRSHALRTVILAEGGDTVLLTRAQTAASLYGIPVSAIPASSLSGTAPDISGSAFKGFGAGTNGGITSDIYTWAKENSVAALSILTVTENAETGEKMEGQERRSQLYNAARLAFETAALTIN